MQCDQMGDQLSLVAELEVESGKPEEYQGLRDWWNRTLPPQGNAADGKFARIR